MDTREKIVTLSDLPARLSEGAWVAVAGRFDPLTLAQAQRLAEAANDGKRVIALVQPGKACLLPPDARAALVAALRTVHLVVVGDADCLRAYRHVETREDEAGEQRRSKDFADFIAQRQAAGKL